MRLLDGVGQGVGVAGERDVRCACLAVGDGVATTFVARPKSSLVELADQGPTEISRVVMPASCSLV